MSALGPLRPDYDAVIVGARPAGAATAMLLARSGLRVLAVDRGRYGSDALSTHGLMRAGVVQLHRWGVLDAVRAAGTPPVRATTFHYASNSIAVAVKPRDGIDGLYAPRRTVLDARLVDAAREAGAEVRHNTKLADLLRSSSGRVSGVVLIDAAGTRHLVRARMVIGADGVHSHTATLVGAETYRRAEHAAASIYGYWSGLADEGFEYYFDHRVSAGVFPTNDGSGCVFASLPPDRFLEHGGAANAPALFSQVLTEAAPELPARLARARPIGGLRSFAGTPGYFRQSHGPGWALVGDAGYFKDPSTAHGITDALRDAELLARAVVRDSPAAVAEYQATRDQLSEALFVTTDRIASFEWTLEELSALHQELSESMRAEVLYLNQLGQPVTGSSQAA
jgi:flavin-dependent dehydrogenase